MASMLQQSGEARGLAKSLAPFQEAAQQCATLRDHYSALEGWRRTTPLKTMEKTIASDAAGIAVQVQPEEPILCNEALAAFRSLGSDGEHAANNLPFA